METGAGFEYSNWNFRTSLYNNGNWDYKNNKSYGANRMALAAGDSWSFALVYTPSTGYYIQILNTQN